MDKTSILTNNTTGHMHPVIDSNDKIGGKYTILNHLGIPSGQADIYLCEKNTERFIVKLYKHGVILDRSVLNKIKAINSPRIVPILDIGQYKGRWFEVSPYYGKGDLSRVEKVDEETLRNFIIPFINEALDDIHKHGMAHMDLKPSNIFIDFTDNLFLGDFGICSVLEDKSIKVTSAKGTFGYRPPESYSEISIKSTQFDYYSFGMTLLHLWQGQSPYAGMSEMQIIAHTLDGKILIPDDMPSDLKMLVQGLTAYDKKKRLTYDDVSKWCKGFDISDRIDRGSEFKRRYLTNREYNFKGEIVESINDLSVVATRSMDLWDEAKKRFSSGLLDEFITACGHDEEAVLLEAKQIVNEDFALAYLFLHGSETGVITWKDNRYSDSEILGKALQNTFPKLEHKYIEMAESGLLKAVCKKDQSLNGSELLQKNLTPQEMVYECAYQFSDQTQFNYKEKPLHSFDELVIELSSEKNSSIKAMDDFMKDSYFKAWVRALGRKKHDDMKG